LQDGLNQRLQALGATFVNIPTDGEFGPVTLRAVRYLQSLAFLPVNGLVDLQTWEFIDQGFSSLPELRLGAVGAMVWLVQDTLHSLGMEIVTDGQFGPKMQDQVRLLQKYSQLIPTGVIGPVTWRQLVTFRMGSFRCYSEWQGRLPEFFPIRY
jgi:peptidoglycan hydrolase-like protein with peptidoglycan-binding domain